MVVNDTLQKYCDIQYQYLNSKVLAIQLLPIPILLFKSIAIGPRQNTLAILSDKSGNFKHFCNFYDFVVICTADSAQMNT